MLEQGRLYLCGSTVDLVSEDDVGEHGSVVGREVHRARVVDLRTDDIGREEIRELDALELQVEGLGQRPDAEGLCESGNAFEQ